MSANSGNVPGENLTLDLDGEMVTLERFEKAIEAFFTLIKTVSNEAAGTGKKLQWVISVEKGSARVIARPVANVATTAIAKQVIEALPRGIREIQKGARSTPKFFNPDALRAARDLATVPDKDGKYVSYVKIRSKGQPSLITGQAIKTVDKLLGKTHQSIGNIEGKLSTISERGSLKFVVYDDLFDRGVQCFINSEDDELTEKAMKAFRKRVSVSGTIQYDKEGLPVSIQAEDIVPFPAKDELPSVDEMCGLFQYT